MPLIFSSPTKTLERHLLKALHACRRIAQKISSQQCAAFLQIPPHSWAASRQRGGTQPEVACKNAPSANCHQAAVWQQREEQDKSSAQALLAMPAALEHTALSLQQHLQQGAGNAVL